jgi:uncharacterized protein YqeY
MSIDTTILNSLKNKSKELRKSHNPLGLFLSSVISAAQDLAKGDTKLGVTPDLNDLYAMRAIRASIKQQDDVINILEQRVHKDEDIEQLLIKKNLLHSLLPQQPSSEELKEAASSFIQTLSVASSKQAIGPTIKYLTGKYGDSLDKALASNVIQEIISS